MLYAILVSYNDSKLKDNKGNSPYHAQQIRKRFSKYKCSYIQQISNLSYISACRSFFSATYLTLIITCLFCSYLYLFLWETLVLPTCLEKFFFFLSVSLSTRMPYLRSRKASGEYCRPPTFYVFSFSLLVIVHDMYLLFLSVIWRLVISFYSSPLFSCLSGG